MLKNRELFRWILLAVNGYRQKGIFQTVNHT